MTSTISLELRLRIQLSRCLGVLALGFGLALPATAQRPANVSAGELALLPEYCIDTMGFLPKAQTGAMGPNAPKWTAQMGPSFATMHHHCRALISERRALMPSTPKSQRENLLERAIADYEFVIDNSEPSFIMLPEVYLKLGDGNLLLRRYAQALEAYGQAVRRNPTYWRPYSRWADALVAYGNPKGALIVLEQGLLNASNQPPLREQYKRLGGNLDKFLKTWVPPAAAASAPSAASAPYPPMSGASATGG